MRFKKTLEDLGYKLTRSDGVWHQFDKKFSRIVILTGSTVTALAYIKTSSGDFALAGFSSEEIHAVSEFLHERGL